LPDPDRRPTRKKWIKWHQTTEKWAKTAKKFVIWPELQRTKNAYTGMGLIKIGPYSRSHEVGPPALEPQGFARRETQDIVVKTGVGTMLCGFCANFGEPLKQGRLPNATRHFFGRRATGRVRLVKSHGFADRAWDYPWRSLRRFSGSGAQPNHADLSWRSFPTCAPRKAGLARP
jgi:hypothetical protein